MNPWLKTSCVAIATALGGGAVQFLVLKPDPFGSAMLGVAFIAAMGFQALVIFAAWGWQRWVSGNRQQYVVPAIFAFGVAFAVFIGLLRIVFHEWFGEGFIFFGWIILLFCGVPLAYLIFCRKAPKPADGVGMPD
jgi:uncharacterized membrane protein